MSATDTASTTRAPDAVWQYFQACNEAREMLPPSKALLDVEVLVDGTTKRFATLTPDDIVRLARVERERITDVTLARLDAVDAEEVRRGSS